MVETFGVYAGGALVQSMSFLEATGADSSSRRWWSSSSLIEVASMLMPEKSAGVAAGLM